jgi:RNA polymerase sigma-70 factor (ECF subfamily)
VNAEPSPGPAIGIEAPYIPATSGDGNGEVHDLDEARRRAEVALVEAAKRGDRDAFAELYRRSRPAVYRLASFRAGEPAAEDIVAETFLRAWKALPAHRDTGAPFAAWLYGIARHVAVDELRRSARAETRDEVPDRSVETGAFDRLALGEAIEQLPEEQRLVIELKYFAGLTNAEVASVIGGTPGAVNAKQWRALGAMRTFLADEEDV